MALRTTRSTVTFAAPFKLKALEAVLAAGTYKIETDEEIIEGNERTVFQRVATLLYVERDGTTQAVTVDPQDLDAALARDRAG